MPAPRQCAPQGGATPPAGRRSSRRRRGRWGARRWRSTSSGPTTATRRPVPPPTGPCAPPAPSKRRHCSSIKAGQVSFGRPPDLMLEFAMLLCCHTLLCCSRVRELRTGEGSCPAPRLGRPGANRTTQSVCYRARSRPGGRLPRRQIDAQRREIPRHVSGTALMCKHPIKIRRNIGPPGCSLPTGHPARQWTRATHTGSGGAISATECSEPFLLHCCLATASEAGTLPGHLRLCGQPNMTSIAVRPGRGSPRDSFATARASSRRFTRGRHPRKGGAGVGRVPTAGRPARTGAAPPGPPRPAAGCTPG